MFKVFHLSRSVFRHVFVIPHIVNLWMPHSHIHNIQFSYKCGSPLFCRVCVQRLFETNSWSLVLSRFVYLHMFHVVYSFIVIAHFNSILSIWCISHIRHMMRCVLFVYMRALLGNWIVDFAIRPEMRWCRDNSWKKDAFTYKISWISLLLKPEALRTLFYIHCRFYPSAIVQFDLFIQIIFNVGYGIKATMYSSFIVA